VRDAEFMPVIVSRFAAPGNPRRLVTHRLSSLHLERVRALPQKFVLHPHDRQNYAAKRCLTA
jgi:hypothetical protein